jgi:hypothetical protein
MLTPAAPLREVGPQKSLALLDRTVDRRETARLIRSSVRCAR